MFSLQLVHLGDGCKLLSVLCLSWCLSCCVLFRTGRPKGPLGYCVLGQRLSSGVKILAGTSGHYSNKNSRNLIRSQKICVLFAALVVTV